MALRSPAAIAELAREPIGQDGAMARVGDVLIVRHGVGRGRLANVGDEVLEALAYERPELHQAIRVTATGEDPPDLAGVAGVVFWLGDPLRELYPACFEDACRIADDARQLGLRLVNPPEALSNTIKSVQARLWMDAGLSVARHAPFDNADGLAEAAGAVPFPALLRSETIHAQHLMHYCDTPDDVARIAVADVAFPGALAEFVDTRWPAAQAPHPIWSTLFHKKRTFVFGPVQRTSHLFFARSPIVSSSSCTFREAERFRRRPWTRLSAPRGSSGGWLARAIADDITYWEQGTEAQEVMTTAVRALGLDYAAIDYSTRADGTVALWEANPHFVTAGRHWRNLNLPRRRRTPERLRSYREAIAEFLAAVADGW